LLHCIKWPSGKLNARIKTGTNWNCLLFDYRLMHGQQAPNKIPVSFNNLPIGAESCTFTTLLRYHVKNKFAKLEK